MNSPDNLNRFKARSRKLIFYESKKFKEAEKKRMEQNKPEHGQVIYGEVKDGLFFCSLYDTEEDKVIPGWLFAMRYGDYTPYFDMDWEEDNESD